MRRSTLARCEAMARLYSRADSLRSWPVGLRRGTHRPGADVGGVGESAGSAVGVQPAGEQGGQSRGVPGFRVIHRAGLRGADQYQPAVGGTDDLDVEPAAMAFTGVHTRGVGALAAVAGGCEEPVDTYGGAQL